MQNLPWNVFYRQKQLEIQYLKYIVQKKNFLELIAYFKLIISAANQFIDIVIVCLI